MRVQLISAFSDNYIFAVSHREGGSCFVVDPGDADPVLAFLADTHLSLDSVLITHHHADHIGGLQKLLAQTGCERVVGPAYDVARIKGITEQVKDGDLVSVGGYKAKVLFTPGHTKGHICYHFAEDNALFCGDTLFSAGCGRMFEGDQDEMWNSLNRIAALDDTTKIYCAHEYTLSNIKFALTVDPENAKLLAYNKRCKGLRENQQPTIPSTIGTELEINPFLRAGSAQRFGELRRAKDVF